MDDDRQTFSALAHVDVFPRPLMVSVNGVEGRREIVWPSIRLGFHYSRFVGDVKDVLLRHAIETGARWRSSRVAAGPKSEEEQIDDSVASLNILKA